MEAPGAAFRDPRHNDLGYRIVAAADRLAAFDHDASAFERHRIGLGIPEGGIDFVYGDTFVHDANLDLLHGVDFGKGCYVGQEVVSRVHHRASARKRIAKLAFYGEAPQVGTEIVAGALNIGNVTSALEHEGLAAVRTDRLAEAQSMNLPLLAGATLVGMQLPGESQVVRPSYAEDVF
jgi:folate-binding protein YgfZ